MERISPPIKLHTYRESEESGTLINCLVLEYRGNNYQLHGGTSDTIHIFTESICLYVLTINKRKGYVGLNAYMTPEPDPINSVFLHSTHEIRETLGHRWESMSPATMVRRLQDMLF